MANEEETEGLASIENVALEMSRSGIYNYHIINESGIYYKLKRDLMPPNTGIAPEELRLDIKTSVDKDSYFFNPNHKCTISGKFNLEKNFTITSIYNAKFTWTEENLPNINITNAEKEASRPFKFSIDAQVDGKYGIVKIDNLTINNYEGADVYNKGPEYTISLITNNNSNRNASEELELTSKNTFVPPDKRGLAAVNLKKLDLSSEIERIVPSLLNILDTQIKEKFERRLNNARGFEENYNKSKNQSAVANGNTELPSAVAKDDASLHSNSALGKKTTKPRRTSLRGGGQRSLRRVGRKTRRKAKLSNRRRSGRRGKRTSRR